MRRLRMAGSIEGFSGKNYGVAATLYDLDLGVESIALDFGVYGMHYPVTCRERLIIS